MPIATPAVEALRAAGPNEIVDAVASWARTLALLHGRGFAHRDIKPANLYRLGRVWQIGDFGLARPPVPTNATRTREDVGAKWTIAPEMRRSARTADGPAADVYSLAKTLWIFLSGTPSGFEGQYSTSSAVALRRRVVERTFLHAIEDLLVEATDHEPTARPTAAQFAERLDTWRETAAEFHSRSLGDWDYAVRGVTTNVPPSRIVWNELDAIVEVLTAVGRMANANHMFYPRGGGNDLEGAERAREDGCIAIRTGSAAVIVRPRALLLERFVDDPRWNYLRLEVDSLEPILSADEEDGDEKVESPPSGRSEQIDHEELVELTPGEYVDRTTWDEGTYGYDETGEPEPLPGSARLVCRYLRGDFVIFAKRSPYNLDSSTYDGRHSTFSTDGFRAYVARQIEPRTEAAHMRGRPPASRGPKGLGSLVQFASRTPMKSQ